MSVKRSIKINPQLLKGLNDKLKTRDLTTTILNLEKGKGKGNVHPDVIYFPNGKDGFKFWLFYTPYPPDEAELPFLCRSNDLKKFSYNDVSNPLFRTGDDNTWDAHHLADLDVVYTNNKWLMYYAGAIFIKNKKMVQVGAARSKNGLEWIKYKNKPILDPVEMGTAKNYKTKTLFTSTPSVVIYRSKYYMIYALRTSTGYPKLYVAVSQDGLNFESYDTNPVLEGTDKWELCGVNHPKLFFYQNNFYLYYVGRNRNGEHQLGFAEADSTDLTTWKKSRLNPVLSPKRSFKNKLLLSDLFFMERHNLPGAYSLRERLKKIRMDWDSYNIYRSCPIVTGEGELAIFDEHYYLFVSGYDLNSPKIGLMKIKLNR